MRKLKRILNWPSSVLKGFPRDIYLNFKVLLETKNLENCLPKQHTYLFIVEISIAITRDDSIHGTHAQITLEWVAVLSVNISGMLVVLVFSTIWLLNPMVVWLIWKGGRRGSVHAEMSANDGWLQLSAVIFIFPLHFSFPLLVVLHLN